MLVQQQEIEQTVQAIDDFQNELDRTLDQVEQNVDQIFASQSHLNPTNADVEREAAYQTAASVDQRLTVLQESLVTALAQADEANAPLHGDVALIVQICTRRCRTAHRTRHGAGQCGAGTVLSRGDIERARLPTRQPKM